MKINELIVEKTGDRNFQSRVNTVDIGYFTRITFSKRKSNQN